MKIKFRIFIIGVFNGHPHYKRATSACNYKFKQLSSANQPNFLNESEPTNATTSSTAKHANAAAARLTTADATEPSIPTITAANWLEPRHVDANGRISPTNASKSGSLGRLKVQGTKRASSLGLRRKLAKGLLLAGSIQACKSGRVQHLPGCHQH